jgi:DNA-binding CsgD family transcriptional regulator
MSELNRILLALYRGAADQPLDEFPEFALGLLKEAVPFDSAAWWISMRVSDRAATTHSVHLHREPPEMVREWQAINNEDSVLAQAIKHPGSAVIFHPPTLFAMPAKAAARDYAARFSHRNGIAVLLADREQRFVKGVSLYRANDCDHYRESERGLFELISPHLCEALKINRQFRLPNSEAHSPGFESRAIAVVRNDGVIEHCGPDFVALVRLEFSQWRPPCLPEALFDALRASGRLEYRGKVVALRGTAAGEVMVLRICKLVDFNQLTAREFEAASLFGSGMSYKEIAREMGIAPVTVRNFLQKTYAKLQIGNKAALAAWLRRELP